jgi:signal transduction histidine kinase
MIKRLQRRFIAIAMCSVTLVLTLIIGGINIINFIHIERNANSRLSILAENDGAFPQEFTSRTQIKQPSQRLSPETPFDTRYFSVLLDENGTVLFTATDHIAAISNADASDYAASLYKKGKQSGYIGTYKYCTVSRTSEDGGHAILYIFLDCEREISTFSTFLLASILISLAGLLLVFLLVVLLSRWIVRPAAESYEKQKHFITDASHEIKTPLTIIDANTEVLEMEQGENEWTQSIRNQIKRLTELTNKLVFLSRMDEESSRLTMLDFSLSDAVDETALSFAPVAAASQKEFSCDIAPHISYHGDEALIRKLVSLLLDNAMKYSTDGGAIRLSLTAGAKNIQLRVWNTTEPMTVGKHDELFERFYRADASRNSSTGGHGIGLSVAKAIVLSHKGSINARSEDGNSILFTITL